jgi:2-polyprenyl-3-methyl-5-hydroxy-6-metoxy-1,4-benzoquinol methylase
MLCGTREKFNYFECTRCGCLQITEYLENIAEHYGEGYYSFKDVDEAYFKINPLKRFLKKELIKHYVEHKSFIGRLCSFYYKNPYYYLENTDINFESSIIDVGCGVGSLIVDMKYNGFKNLHGVDPFIEKNLHYTCGVTVEKKDLFNVNNKYDLVMLHHSLEHMPNQHEVFQGLKNLIDENGLIIIRIPLSGCYAWKKYGVNWYAIDPPRHYYMHTPQSMEILAEEAGLRVDWVRYDSTASQFYRSEELEQDIAFPERSGKIDPHRLKQMKIFTEELNESQQGGQACFYLVKNN